MKIKSSFKEKNVRNQDGFTLVGVVMVLLVFSVLGVSILSLTVNTLNISSDERNNQSAYYIAEAALNYEMDKLKKRIADIEENDIVVPPEQSDLLFENVPGEDARPEAIVEVDYAIDDEDEYKMISTGIIGDAERTLEQKFSIETESQNNGVPEMALLTKNNIRIINGYIDGDIGTMSNQAHSIEVSNSGRLFNLSKNIFVPIGYADSAVKLEGDGDHYVPVIEEKNFREFPSLDFPSIPEDYPVLSDKTFMNNYNFSAEIKDGNLEIADWSSEGFTLHMDENLEFGNIDFSGKWNIDTGDTPKEIVVEDLKVGWGDINIIGKGLTIYVKGQLELNGQTFNTSKDPNKLNIFLKGTDSSSNTNKKIVIGGAQKLYGSIYAEDADIELTNSGGFEGNIFTGGASFKVSGDTTSASPLLFAPDAKFEITGSGKVNGTILADSFVLDGGGELTYEEMQFISGPISIEEISSGETTENLNIVPKTIREKE